MKKYIRRCNQILYTSATMLALSTILMLGSSVGLRNDVETTSFDIRTMSLTSAAMKSGKAGKEKKLIEVDLSKVSENNKGNKTNLSLGNKTWYLPTEQGRITTYPHYGHIAYDITSPRGQGEVIYPVASGQISSIYTDGAGALIVTVRHNIGGKYYTSQYVHLSGYADIHVGQDVTPFTPLGWMGTTGYSTGVHLHIALVDCNLYGGTDACGDLGAFFNHANARLGQGFYGLGSVIYVPDSWNSR